MLPTPCDAGPAWQNLGIPDTGSTGQYGQSSSKRYGRNGIVVFKADNVSIENLTACNFLSGSGDAGNEIWWNGGDGTAKIGLHGYSGGYLTATTTYFGGESTAAAYGIFSSNSSGPASWNQLYADNFNDSGMYVGACLQACDVTIDNAWMEYNALGYSGTNSGGSVVIENSQFDNNEDGVDTNTQIDGDPPAPQNGDCPNGATSPITHTHSCWVFINNYVHNNNYAEFPGCGKCGGRALRDGHDRVRRPQCDGHGQPVRRQRGMGDPVRPVSRQREAVGRPDVRRDWRSRELCARVHLRPRG